jgi:hypothetical protein
MGGAGAGSNLSTRIFYDGPPSLRILITVGESGIRVTGRGTALIISISGTKSSTSGTKSSVD